MDNTSSSDSGLEDASMDDSEQEHEYEYGLEESDPHEDYEGIPEEDFEDVPDDEDDEMDDDDDEEDHALAIANFAGVVGELRVFSSYDFNRHLNGFRLARFENRPPPSDDHFFRDMFQETIENIQRANSRIREQIRSMRRGHLVRTVEPLLLSTRVRSSSRDHLSLHPALHRPCLPASEPERPATVVRTLVNLQNVSNALHPQNPNSQSDLLDRINSQSLTALHEVDLARSVNASSHVDILSNLSRGRPFERPSQRERDREKVPSSLARRWCYEPQSTGGDFLPIIFDGDSAPRRPARTLPRQPIVANETHESVSQLANTITERIDNLMTDIFKADNEVEEVRKKFEEQKKEEEKKKIEEAKKAEEKEADAKELKQDEKSDKSKENMDIASEPGEAPVDHAAPAPAAAELNESAPQSIPSAQISSPIPVAPTRTDAQRSAPGLANAQEEASRPDLVMDSVEVAQRRNEEQRNIPTEQPNQESAAEESENPQESTSTDFAAVAARRAAAAGISLDAPANNNPEVVAAATESTGIDPAFLAALPEEMRTEILTQYYERICTNNDPQAGQSTAQNTTAVNQDFLMALPPELRAEVLQLDAEFQSRQEAANGTGSRNDGSGGNENNNGAMAAADMDNATFLATLAPELREEILLESGEAFIRSLPPNMAAEARILRERDMSSRLPWRVHGQDLGGMGLGRRAFHERFRDGPLNGRRGTRSHPREPPIYRWKKIENIFLREGPNAAFEPTETLQKNGLSSLVQLLWLKHGQYGKNLVYQVLSHACKTTESRLLVLDLLIDLVTSSHAEAGSSSSATNAVIDRSRRHGVAIRRGLELLILLCKNDAVVAETLLGLPRSKEELEKYESVSLGDSGESEEQKAPQISVSTLISLLSGSLFTRSNSHLEQLVSLISTVCHSIPPSHYNPSDKRRDRRSRRTNRAIAPISGQMGDDHMNFFVVEHDDEEHSMYDAQDDDAVDDEDSEDDIFRSIRRLREAGTSTLRETSGDGEAEGDNASLGQGSKAAEKEEEKDIIIPDRYRIPKLQNTELIALSKVLLRSGCSERTYDRASRTIGLLGELRCNRTVILYSLASIAAEAGQDIQAEYSKCIDACRESEDPKGKPKRADITASFAAASASNELTMLRVVKSLSTLLKHEANQIAQAKSEDDDERKALVARNNRFQTSLMAGLQDLWKALDTLLELVSEETKQKDQKGVEKITAIQSAAQAFHDGRKRSASKGLSPTLARLSHMIEAFLVTHSIEETDPQTENMSANQSGVSSKPSIESPRTPVSPVNSTSTRSQDMEEDAVKSMEEELAVFVERHRGPINALLRVNPGLLENSFKGALRHPHAIDFDNKKAYFRNLIRRRSSEAHAGTIRIKVRRDRVFDDSYHQLRMRSPDEMKGRLHVQFTGEEGVDAGGVSREWYVILMRQIFDANYALFTKSAAKAVTYQPDKRSYINREHLENFHFVGRIIGKAIYDGQLLDAYFTRSFYKHILGLKPTYHDIEAQDPEYYKSLKWMLENDCTGIIDYNMSAEYEEFGKMSVVDLIPNGRDIPVTEENKADYVRLVTDIRMTKSIEKQIEAFKRGFHEIIPHEDCKIFNELELELLMSGLPDIDMADMKANVEYTGYTASSPQINWFWRCVSKMDQLDLARLVMFVTGSSKMPLEGFSHLQGMNGIQKLQIHRVAGNTMRLPSAHTCFNQLDLPEYSSAELLSERLLRAVRDCSVGFGFA